MNTETRVLAFDFGASSGRAILAVYSGEGLHCEEIHRFDNTPVKKDGTLFWDFEAIVKEINIALGKAGSFDSLAFDTWGVDFGLLDEHGKLLQNPVHYRDERTQGICEKAFKTMLPETLYTNTGNQIMQLNTLFQILAMREKQPELFSRAKTLLFMPNLFAYTLCGVPSCEISIASTSQLLNPETADWSGEVLNAFDIDKDLLQKPLKSGSIIGRLQSGAKVIAAAGHDTQCAVAAMPVCGKESGCAAFLSCGTWSLLGTELSKPVLTKESMANELSNELSANGKINYLKNIIGLWLIQESRRAFRKGGEEYSYADLERLALQAKPHSCFIDPDAPEFAPPGDIPARIREYCRKTSQYVPQTPGEIMRCIYESLALKYRLALEQLSKMTKQSFNVLHVLGGGAKDGLLCRMTADCCKITVKAGPTEATALGNIIIQLTALGAVESIDEGRRLIAKTQSVKVYEPSTTSEWEQAYKKYKELLKKE